MSLKRPVTIAQARRWPAAAARRESFCARMGGMREKLTSDRTARDPRSKINRALAAWDCDEPELLERKHVTKGIRPMKITQKMVGAEARRNPRKPREKVEPFPSKLEGYGPRKGLEGPFLMRNGRVVYYDPAEGAYYDPTTDFYLTSDEASGLHSNPRRKPTVSRKISQLVREGYPQRQAVAIALEEERRGKVRRNPGAKTMYRFALVPNDGGFEYGMDHRTAVRFIFSARDRKKGIYRSFQLPASAVKNAEFQAWVDSLPEKDVVMTLGQLREVIRSYMT